MACAASMLLEACCMSVLSLLAMFSLPYLLK